MEAEYFSILFNSLNSMINVTVLHFINLMFLLIIYEVLLGLRLPF